MPRTSPSSSDPLLRTRQDWAATLSNGIDDDEQVDARVRHCQNIFGWIGFAGFTFMVTVILYWILTAPEPSPPPPPTPIFITTLSVTITPKPPTEPKPTPPSTLGSDDAKSSPYFSSNNPADGSPSFTYPTFYPPSSSSPNPQSSKKSYPSHESSPAMTESISVSRDFTTKQYFNSSSITYPTFYPTSQPD